MENKPSEVVWANNLTVVGKEAQEEGIVSAKLPVTHLSPRDILGTQVCKGQWLMGTEN